jgi:prolyl oligopeptidase
MKRTFIVFLFLLPCILFIQLKPLQSPPPTRIAIARDTLHGVVIEDPYRWLEDKDSPETRAWIDSQNNYTKAVTGVLPGREQLKQRLTELIRLDVVGIPIERGGRYFFTKRLAEQDLSVLYMREGLKGKDEILIDPHPMSVDHTTSVGIEDISLDGTVMVYNVRFGGQDETAIRLLDVNDKKNLSDSLPPARYFGVSITPDKQSLYYTRMESDGPRVYLHTVGTDPAKDIYVFGKGYGPDKIISTGLSEDGKYLQMNVLYGSAAKKTELYIMDVAHHTPIVTLVNDIEARFSGDIENDHFYMQTNWNAPNDRILDVDLNQPDLRNWKEIIPPGKSPITGFSLVGGKLFVNYLENVVSRIKIFDTNGKYQSDISFPSIGTVGGMSGNWKSKEAFFSFASFHIPQTIYRYNVEKGTREEWARLNVPIDSKNFIVKQVWYESKDGTKIPMFLVHNRGITLDGNNPTLMTGYGGFDINITPGFSSRAAAWVEHGGIYAVPNLRGGGEFGEEWHKAGMLEKKQNVFDDFIAAAEWLIKYKYTSAKKLAITGGSNGGLLVGAAMTQRPDLFQAVVCQIPLLDMLRYHKFLVAKFWIPEYGYSENAEQFKFIYAYSPYHHVVKGTQYPATLFITGDGDTRVDPLHARKMTALLQASTSSDRPIVLLYDKKAGHSGGKPVSKIIEDLTDELNFVFWQVGANIKTN